MVSVLVAYRLGSKVKGARGKNGVVKVANQLVVVVQELLEMVGIVCMQSGCPSGKNT